MAVDERFAGGHKGFPLPGLVVHLVLCPGGRFVVYAHIPVLNRGE